LVKDSLLVDNTEPTLNVALAELLQQRELQALGEAVIHREIARTLFVTENTVKIHMRNILGKMHVHSW